MKTHLQNQFWALAAALALPVASGAATDQSPGTSAAPAKEDSPSAGVVVHQGKAYIISPLQYAMPLPDGSKIEPNGMLKEQNGATRAVGPNQMLTLDGQMSKAPFPTDSSVSKAPATTTVKPSASGFNGTSNVFSGHQPLWDAGKAAPDARENAFHEEAQPGIDSGKSSAPRNPENGSQNIPEGNPEFTD